MKLLFIRQPASEPVRIGACFRVAYINRPIERQAGFFEHGKRHPDVTVAMPESWVLDSVSQLPGPSFVTPKGAIAITACLNKPEKIAVGNVVPFDRKCGNGHNTLASFVVPNECFSVRVAKPER